MTYFLALTICNAIGCHAVDTTALKSFETPQLCANAAPDVASSFAGEPRQTSFRFRCDTGAPYTDVIRLVVYMRPDAFDGAPQKQPRHSKHRRRR